MNWMGGLKGAGSGFYEGAASAVGVYRNDAGKMRFGGQKGYKGIIGGGFKGGLAFGAIGLATGDTNLAQLGFIVSGRAGVPWMVGINAINAWRNDGAAAALGSMATDVALFGTFDAALKGGTALFKKGTAAAAASSNPAVASAASGAKNTAGRFGSVVGRTARFAAPIAIGAAIGYGVYKGASRLAAYNRSRGKMEFAGDQRAFNTNAAYTMRQRAVFEMQRSHTNARTLLGNEAALMHNR